MGGLRCVLRSPRHDIANGGRGDGGVEAEMRCGVVA
jgi:hypothetical protein